MAEEYRKGETILEILISLALLSILIVGVFSSYLFMRRMAGKAEKFIHVESLCLDLDNYYDSDDFDMNRLSASQWKEGIDETYIPEAKERDWALHFFKYEAQGEKLEDEINLNIICKTIDDGLGEFDDSKETTEQYVQRKKDSEDAQLLYDSLIEMYGIEEDKLEAFNGVKNENGLYYGGYQQNETYLYKHYYDGDFKEISPQQKENAEYTLSYYYVITPTYIENGVDKRFEPRYSLMVDVYNSDNIRVIEELNYGVAKK